MKEVNAPNCGRENDLISFLYGELNEVDAFAFQRHLHECGACRTELNGFGDVRESVVAWRNESLGSIGLPAQVTNAATEARPSAIAALREFFNLSPLWLKGAVAFATLLLCVFGALGVARLREKPPATVVTTPAPAGSQEIRALVDQRVQEELKRIKDAGKQSAAPLVAGDASQQRPGKRNADRSTEMAATSHQSARRPLSKTEREQLAADLRLVASKGDSDLHLLDDTINR
jgi:anti-sigma factor RsiW